MVEPWAAAQVASVLGAAVADALQDDEGHQVMQKVATASMQVLDTRRQRQDLQREERVRGSD